MYSLKRLDRASRHLVEKASWVVISLLLAGCSAGSNSSAPASVKETGMPGAEASVGERLFLETRFAQSFKVILDHGGDINNPKAGDPVVATAETPDPLAPITPGAFKDMSMNCRACHMVDDLLTSSNERMRTYADFAPRSPIPARIDGKTHAPRNSPALVNSAIARPGGVLFHFDSEFNSMEDLVAANFTGRNFGWLPGERAQAIAHIARVVRGDDGSDDLAQDTSEGLSYRTLFTGSDPDIPDELRLPPAFRAFVGSGSDEVVFNAVVKVVAAYVNQLQFSQQEDSGALIRSPFDVFLKINGLPEQPDLTATPPETPLGYSRRLLQLVLTREAANTLTFVTKNPNKSNGKFVFHPSQTFVFGVQELEGLKIFLTEPLAIPAAGNELTDGKIGNCLACHAAPNFTDFKLHNTGTAQKEYDDLPSHGAGAFMALNIPDLASRTANDLPATEQNPGVSERFRSIPSDGTTLTDLGVWNIFANPAVPNPQVKIKAILCDDQQPCPLSDSALLDLAIARFKTPGLRDLGHSASYMHNGQFGTLDNIIGFYRGVSGQARVGTLRNGATQLQGIALTAGDATLLVVFLNSLNEDYQ